jgi:hypothetical protein
MKTILILLVVIAFHLGLALASALGTRILSPSDSSILVTSSAIAVERVERPRGQDGPVAPERPEAPGGDGP